jgi:hypothetical protein
VAGFRDGERPFMTTETVAGCGSQPTGPLTPNEGARGGAVLEVTIPNSWVLTTCRGAMRDDREVEALELRNAR